jgi:hypothetical protein
MKQTRHNNTTHSTTKAAIECEYSCNRGAKAGLRLQHSLPMTTAAGMLVDVNTIRPYLLADFACCTLLQISMALRLQLSYIHQTATATPKKYIDMLLTCM